MKPIYVISICTVAILITALALRSNRDAQIKSSLKGQNNATLTFHGIAVDESGRPLPDVDFLVEVEAIPADWTFDTRGKPHEFSTLSARSGRNGRFRFDVTGHILRVKQVQREGYRHLYDLDIGATHAIDNMAYMLNAWSDPWYKSDEQNPAVYVLVTEGVRTVSTLPTRGGSNSANGKYWTVNKPGWPTKPSLKDVQRQPVPSPTSSTQP